MTLLPGLGGKTMLISLLLIFTLSLIPQTQADFTPPSLTDWLGSGETTGIFTSGNVKYNITSGEQYNPTEPQIRLRSNTSQSINFRYCVADFRLVRVETNGTLTLMNYARFSLNGISVDNDVFWSSMIFDYPSIYRFGVVIWNTSNGTVVGRLIATIQTSAEPIVTMTTDKKEYTRFDTISFTMINRGPPVTTSSVYFVYREVDGGWVYVSKWGLADFAGGIVVSKDKPYTGSVNSAYADLSQSGVYKVVKGYLLSVLGEIGVASAEFRINSVGFLEPERIYSSLSRALIGAVTGIVIFFILQKSWGNRGAPDGISVEYLTYRKRENRKKLAAILLGLILLYLFLGPSIIFPTVFLGRGVAREGDFELVFEPQVVDNFGLRTVRFKLTATNLGGSQRMLARGIDGLVVNIYGMDGRLVAKFPSDFFSGKNLVLYYNLINPGGSLVIEPNGGNFLLLLPGVYRVSAQLAQYKSVETTSVIMIIIP